MGDVIKHRFPRKPPHGEPCQKEVEVSAEAATAGTAVNFFQDTPFAEPPRRTPVAKDTDKEVASFFLPPQFH
jgi:hypothetical protein